MKHPWIYAKNLMRCIGYKIRYGGSVQMGPIQSFEKLRIERSGAGKLTMGSYNQNREKMYLGVAGGELTIGSHCFFNINASITCMESIRIGDNCKFGNNLVIVDHDHNFRTGDPEFISSPISIGDNVWVGANVTILRGTVIEHDSVIAAGSVVKGTVKSHTVYVKGESRNI